MDIIRAMRKEFWLNRAAGSRMALVAILGFVSLFAVANEDSGGDTVEPREKALLAAEALEATKISVDSNGNLWSWTRNTGSLTIITPGGVVSTNNVSPGAAAVAFESDYGAAWLESGSMSLVLWTAATPGVTQAFEVQEAYGDLAWLSSQRIALSTTRADARVEILDVSTGEIVERWGAEEPLETRPGTVRLNHFWLHYDQARELLYSLESYSGDLQVFDRAGTVRTDGRVPDRDGEKLREWLDKADARNRKEGNVETVTLHQWPGFSVDQDGAVWIHQTCKVDGNSQSLHSTKISLSGETIPTNIDVGSDGCCYLTSTLWGSWWVIYRDPENPRNGCVQTRRNEDEA
ncbi:MAG: hypothetical protein MPN21_24865 [Thermoanaerobaculia bacterium]|nr:hypothetical protein [Thermoanaerobaculia bacterium]